MQPIDADDKPAVHATPLNHVGLWIDDLRGAVAWLEANGVRFAPGGIRAGAAGHDICFIHPKANDEFPIAGEGVLIELVQAPAEVIAAWAAARDEDATVTVQAILKMGDPRLLRIARPVERFATPELRTLVADMFETMHAVYGAGLAAPQIGVDLQLVIFGFSQNERYPDAPPVPETVLLNPQVEPIGDDEEEGWEGCLSVPGTARRRAALRAHPLSRRRSRGPADRARGRGLPCARRAARMRPPGRQALSDADPRLRPIRLHAACCFPISPTRPTRDRSPSHPCAA